jgi:hypothetical protein
MGNQSSSLSKPMRWDPIASVFLTLDPRAVNTLSLQTNLVGQTNSALCKYLI